MCIFGCRTKALKRRSAVIAHRWCDTSPWWPKKHCASTSTILCYVCEQNVCVFAFGVWSGHLPLQARIFEFSRFCFFYSVRRTSLCSRVHSHPLLCRSSGIFAISFGSLSVGVLYYFFSLYFDIRLHLFAMFFFSFVFRLRIAVELLYSFSLFTQCYIHNQREQSTSMHILCALLSLTLCVVCSVAYYYMHITTTHVDVCWIRCIVLMRPLDPFERCRVW